MLFRAFHDGSEFAVTLRGRSYSATRDDRITLAADMTGRLYSWFTDGVMHRRALDGRVRCTWHLDGRRGSRWLSESEADAMMSEAAQFAADFAGRMREATWRWEGLDAPDEAQRLEAARLLRLSADWTAPVAADDASRFRQVYAPIGILPPDHYLSLVLQATDGCSFNSCAFCRLYPQPYRVRSVEDFRRHVAAVRDYFGEGLSLRRRRIFLGAANALAVPMPRLLPILDEVVREFGVPAQGIHAFVDGFTGERKTSEDYRRLRERGLRRVYLGLESGHDPLLDFVSKPATGGDVLDTVRKLKAAGVSAAVIVMIGLGGHRFADAHVADTAALLNAMDLGAGDLIYFSELIEQTDTAYPALARQEGLGPLTEAEMAAQQHQIRAALRFRAQTRPILATYDVRDFLY